MPEIGSKWENLNPLRIADNLQIVTNQDVSPALRNSELRQSEASAGGLKFVGFSEIEPKHRKSI
jgi:hypothetical protein